MSDRAPLQILLVEDDAVDRQMVRRLIADSGLRANTIETESAAAGLGAIRKERIDCVILDYRLPDCDGVDLAKKIVEEHGLQAPPIVMLTGSGNERLAVTALRIGICDYLVKEEATAAAVGQAILGAIKATASARRELEQSLLLERQAVTDPLTGLGNRRRFDESFREALDAATRSGALVGLLVIDLNRFKAVNDTFGHGTGDEVLKEVGRRLSQTVRQGDIPVRLGGDEFGVIMTSGVSSTTASQLANRIAVEIKSPYEVINTAISIGASVGFSLAPADGEEIEALLQVADRRMYSHKLDTRTMPILDDESGRIRDLEAYGILDTPAEEAFDKITRLASTVLGAPIALVSLVDADRQWFKSKVGLSVSETPREVAFCAHAIASNDVMVVEDTKLDDRFSANPLVTDDPNIRFYAGAPLRSSRGYNLGTLCVIDRVPRTLTKAQEQTLVDLAGLVVRELELRRSALPRKH